MHYMLALAAAFAQIPTAISTGAVVPVETVAATATPASSPARSIEKRDRAPTDDPSGVPRGEVPTSRVQALILLTLAGLCLAAAGLDAMIRIDRRDRFRPLLELLAGLFLFLGAWGLIADSVAAARSERPSPPVQSTSTANPSRGGSAIRASGVARAAPSG